MNTEQLKELLKQMPDTTEIRLAQRTGVDEVKELVEGDIFVIWDDTAPSCHLVLDS